MKRWIARAELAVLLLAVVGDADAVMGLGPASSSLSWSLHLSKERIFQGEPVLLVIEITNSASTPVSIDFGTDGIGALSMEVKDSTGEVVERGPPIRRYGVTTVDRFVVPSHAVRQKKEILNRWCTTSVPPGRYDLVCLVAPRSTQPLRLTCSFEVLEPDDTKLREILDGLARRSKNDVSPDDRNFALEMLGFAAAPLAVEYQMRLAMDRGVSVQHRELAVNGLARIGNKVAAQCIVSLCEDSSLPVRVHEAAVIAAYNLKASGRPDAAAVVDTIIKRHVNGVRLHVNGVRL